MQLEPGMRVRCVVQPGRRVGVFAGQYYKLAEVDGSFARVFGDSYWYHVSRFKPIIRVKALSRTTAPSRSSGAEHA